MDRARFRASLIIAVALLASGCSLTRAPPSPGALPWPPLPGGIDPPPVAVQPPPGAQLLGLAEGFVGAPYLFGGNTPEGFDCSGLVRHVHGLAGIDVPRTALAQHAAARSIDDAALQPGDVVFFASRRGRVDHVGIYAGDGRFLHAPRRGRPVGYDRLDDAWFETRFVGAGRFWTAPPEGGQPAR